MVVWPLVVCGLVGSRCHYLRCPCLQVSTVIDPTKFLCAQVHRRMEQYVMVSSWEPVALWNEGRRRRARSEAGSDQSRTLCPSEIMEPACPDGSSALPDDGLIVEDDAI